MRAGAASIDGRLWSGSSLRYPWAPGAPVRNELSIVKAALAEQCKVMPEIVIAALVVANPLSRSECFEMATTVMSHGCHLFVFLMPDDICEEAHENLEWLIEAMEAGGFELEVCG